MLSLYLTLPSGSVSTVVRPTPHWPQGNQVKRKLEAIRTELQGRIERLESLEREPTEREEEYLDAYTEALEGLEQAIGALESLN